LSLVDSKINKSPFVSFVETFVKNVSPSKRVIGLPNLSCPESTFTPLSIREMMNLIGEKIKANIGVNEKIKVFRFIVFIREKFINKFVLKVSV
jgi:hypothetical protein